MPANFITAAWIQQIADSGFLLYGLRPVALSRHSDQAILGAQKIKSFSDVRGQRYDASRVPGDSNVSADAVGVDHLVRIILTRFSRNAGIRARATCSRQAGQNQQAA
jgi:hypothetical protein